MFESSWLGTWLAVAVLSTAARGGVIVVNAAGGGDYTSLASAVAAAQEGDTILVKAGDYAGFSLSGKSLSIVAETGAVVNVQSGVFVTNLAASQTVVFGGLRIHPLQLYFAALRIQTNQGAFRAHGCTFEGSDNFGEDQSFGAYLSGNTAGVAFVDCVFRGGNSGTYNGSEGQEGGDALWIPFSSQAALYDCTLVGGNASAGYSWNGGRGGAGAYLGQAGTFLHASGSSFQGGNGGFACDWLPVDGGDGGAGVLLGPNVASWFVESSSSGGLPGGPLIGCEGFPGQPGPSFAGSGRHFDLPVGKLEMDAPWLVREGNEALFTLRGEPGVDVYLRTSDATEFVGAASWRGVNVVKKTKIPEPVMILGTMPASGVMTVGLLIPPLPAGIEADTFFLQVYRRGPDGLVIGSFAALTVLDAAY